MLSRQRPLLIRPENRHQSFRALFFISQTPIEQKHIGDALVFELSKVERPDIRSRTVSHLLNIDATLAATVADGLGLPIPDPAVAARKPITDLSASDKLSIVKNGPNSFKGRKLGILLIDGADATIFTALVGAIDTVGGVYEVVAPRIAGVTLSDGTTVAPSTRSMVVHRSCSMRSRLLCPPMALLCYRLTQRRRTLPLTLLHIANISAPVRRPK